MKKNIRLFCCLIAMLILASLMVIPSQSFASVASSPTTVNRIVAVVNHDVITQVDLDKQIKLITLQLKQSNTSIPPLNVFSKQILNQLINQRLQLQLAKKNNIQVTAKQLNQAISKIASQNQQTVADFYQQAKAEGIDKAEVNQQIKNDIMISQLQKVAMLSHIQITEQDVDNYLQQLASKPSLQNKQYHLKDILIDLPVNPTAKQISQAKKKATKLVEKLKNGENFTKLAIANSSSQDVLQNNGDLGFRTLAELPTSFTKIVVNMKIGDISDPIRTDNGFHILKLIDTRDNKQQLSSKPQVDLREIMLKSRPKQSPEQTKAMAQTIYQQLIKGKSFTQLANRYKALVNAKTDLGWVNIDSLPKPVANVVNKLNLGTISKPILVNGDYYIIKIIGKRQGFMVSQSQRNAIKQLLFQKQMLEQLQTWIKQIRANGYINISPYALTG